MEGESAHEGQEGGGNLDEEFAPGTPGMNVVPHAHYENEHPSGDHAPDSGSNGDGTRSAQIEERDTGDDGKHKADSPEPGNISFMDLAFVYGIVQLETRREGENGEDGHYRYDKTDPQYRAVSQHFFSRECKQSWQVVLTIVYHTGAVLSLFWRNFD